MKLAAIILAAGRSRRFGSADKLLADLGGTCVLGWTVRTILDSGFEDVAVVTGSDDEALRAALTGLTVRFAINAAPDACQGRSIATGIEALPGECDGALIVPADMPALTAAMLERLIAAFAGHDGRCITHFAIDRTPRPPVIWPRALFRELAALDGDRSGRHVLAQHSHLARAIDIPADDVWRLDDIDTPADLAALASRLVTAGDRPVP